MSPSDPFAARRSQMVAEQIVARGIGDPRVLDAMRHVPREAFVPAGLAEEAYGDRALPIDCEQTISQPLIVALMTEALELSGGEHVLEVGTGSGYQAAVLSRLAGDVISIERHPGLSARASEVLARLGCDNVRCVVGDGSLGWPDDAPYGRIIVTAAAADIPLALLDQLAEGGLLVMPIGPYDNQVLRQLRKIGDRTVATPLTGCRFVPLITE